MTGQHFSVAAGFRRENGNQYREGKVAHTLQTTLQTKRWSKERVCSYMFVSVKILAYISETPYYISNCVVCIIFAA